MAATGPWELWPPETLDVIGDAVLLCHPDTLRILAVNAPGRTLLGFGEPKPDCSLDDLVVGGSERIGQDLRRLREDGQRVLADWRLHKRDGSPIDAEVRLRLLAWRGKTVLCIAARDVTEIKRARDLQALYPYHDFLTDLPNHRMFEEMLSRTLAQAARRKRRLAVLSLNLDGFKPVNERLGHVAGNLLLQAAARRIRNLVRSEDLLARLAADQFALALPEVGCAKDAARAAERLIEQFRNPFRLGDQEAAATVSIGISLFPADGETASSLMRNADMALYRAKRHGPGSFGFCGPGPGSMAVAG